MSHGARSREVLRYAVRGEQSTAGALEHIKRAYTDMCTKRKMVPQMEENLERVKKKMNDCRGPQSIKTYLELKSEADRLQKAIKETNEGLEAKAFFERARPLLVAPKDHDTNMEQKREALAMTLFHPEKSVPVYIQTDRCTRCGHDFQIRTEESLVVCPNCALSSKFLQLFTDHMDTEGFAQDTHANHVRSTATGNVDNMSHNDDYPKPSLYEKFLLQFSNKVPKPPAKVKEVILREFSNVHIQHGSKVQPTPVGNILRKHNLKEWAWMSTLIGMMLKFEDNVPLPSFSDERIARYVKYLENLIDALKRTRCRNRKKVSNFKFLTKVFLTMDGDFATAELFENHKTRTVLRHEDRRVGEASALLREEIVANGFQWEHFRSL